MTKAKPAWTNDPYQVPWRKSIPHVPLSLWDRFNSKLLPGPPPPDGLLADCWAWSGSHFKQTGYALMNIKSPDGKWRPTVAHRIAYQLYRADIPPGLVIDHLCCNRACVNPWHLEPVTDGENVRRAWLALTAADASIVGPNWASTANWDGRCKDGHLITPETVYLRPNGKQECRECARARDRKRSKTEKRRVQMRAAKKRWRAKAASR